MLMVVMHEMFCFQRRYGLKPSDRFETEVDEMVAGARGDPQTASKIINTLTALQVQILKTIYIIK